MVARHKVSTRQMCKARRADLALVRSVGAVADEMHRHLALWRLDSRVSLARRHCITLREKLEVVYQALHRLLHRRAWWRDNLVVVDLVRSRRHLVATLPDNSDGLSHLLDTADVAVVAVAVLPDRYVKVDLVVLLVWLRLAQIPWDTGATQHRA